MKLKDARKLTNLTQTQLAGYLGVSQTVVSMREFGTDSPSVDRRRIFDNIFRKQVSWDCEFEPYDPIEQNAIVRFDDHMHG
ncbi:MAG: helix-turn-helix transcriptional regulator [Deltaproteobacteria bacterium]|jgi:transcriptional regulator with XRE-family HTH domain|nr:helix-turn-helix transcriptional regulator [Deltaproteobacteria bacterium]